MLSVATDYAEMLRIGERENGNNAACIVAHLLGRAIDEGVVEPALAPVMGRWLGVVEKAQQYHRYIRQAQSQRLATLDDFRRAVQAYVLDNERGADTLRAVEFDLRR